MEEPSTNAREKKRSSRKRAVEVQLYNADYEYSKASMKKMKSKKKGRRFENRKRNFLIPNENYIWKLSKFHALFILHNQTKVKLLLEKKT